MTPHIPNSIYGRDTVSTILNNIRIKDDLDGTEQVETVTPGNSIADIVWTELQNNKAVTKLRPPPGSKLRHATFDRLFLSIE